jgi:hypothetical protein
MRIVRPTDWDRVDCRSADAIADHRSAQCATRSERHILGVTNEIGRDNSPPSKAPSGSSQRPI